jgi:hypothetical protein
MSALGGQRSGLKPYGTARGDIWYAASQQFDELIGRDWPAEIIALRGVAPVSPQKLQLFQRFDPFGDNAQLETVGHADYCGHDGGIRTGDADLADVCK